MCTVPDDMFGQKSSDRSSSRCPGMAPSARRYRRVLQRSRYKEKNIVHVTGNASRSLSVDRTRPGLCPDRRATLEKKFIGPFGGRVSRCRTRERTRGRARAKILRRVSPRRFRRSSGLSASSFFLRVARRLACSPHVLPGWCHADRRRRPVGCQYIQVHAYTIRESGVRGSWILLQLLAVDIDGFEKKTRP